MRVDWTGERRTVIARCDGRDDRLRDAPRCRSSGSEPDWQVTQPPHGTRVV